MSDDSCEQHDKSMVLHIYSKREHHGSHRVFLLDMLHVANIFWVENRIISKSLICFVSFLESKAEQ